MKKNLAVIAALTLTMTMAACGGSTASSKAPDGSSSQTSPSSGELTPGGEMLYGKVTGIVGNEIEVALVKMPDIEVPEANSSEEKGNEPAIVDAVPMTPAIPAGEAVPDESENLELTGESIKVTIPAGVAILSMGQETTLAALKKGNLIILTVDTLESLKVQSVNILQ